MEGGSIKVVKKIGEFCAGFCGLGEMMFICGKIVAMAIY